MPESVANSTYPQSVVQFGIANFEETTGAKLHQVKTVVLPSQASSSYDVALIR